MDPILVISARSSSIKYDVFAVSRDGFTQREIRGRIDGIGSRRRFRAVDANGRTLADRAYPVDNVRDIPAALKVAGTWLCEEMGIVPKAVGHRVVHGGPDFDRPVVVDHSVISKLEKFMSLAPLSQASSLVPLRLLLSEWPSILQVACFDTAFHREHGPLADCYAIPRELYAQGIRRYGFHGLSCEYIIKALAKVAPEFARKRIIVSHLGHDASMCAIQNGCSVESTMGFSTLDGIPMGTRPGQLDPGAVLYLLLENGMSAVEVQKLLHQGCGLKGLSGISGSMQELEASDDPYAMFAVEYFAYKAALSAGMLVSALQGLDAFVFTGGIGANSAHVRSRIMQRLAWLGISLDHEKNTLRAQRISSRDSRAAVFVIPADEEAMIAEHTSEIVFKTQLRDMKREWLS